MLLTGIVCGLLAMVIVTYFNGFPHEGVKAPRHPMNWAAIVLAFVGFWLIVISSFSAIWKFMR